MSTSKRIIVVGNDFKGTRIIKMFENTYDGQRAAEEYINKMGLSSCSVYKGKKVETQVSTYTKICWPEYKYGS